MYLKSINHNASKHTHTFACLCTLINMVPIHILYIHSHTVTHTHTCKPVGAHTHTHLHHLVGGSWSPTSINQWYKGVTDSGPSLKCLDAPADSCGSVSGCEHSTDSDHTDRQWVQCDLVTADRPLWPKYRPGPPGIFPILQISHSRPARNRQTFRQTYE